MSEKPDSCACSGCGWNLRGKADICATATEGGTVSEFHVSGLDCPDCAAGLVKRLKHADGVLDATLNPVTALLTVRHRLIPAQVVRLVSAAGYTAVQAAALEVTHGGYLHTHRRLFTTLASGILLTAAWLLGLQHSPAQTVITLYVLAILTGGWWTIRRGIASLRSRIIDMNVLMLVAVTGAALIGEWSEGAVVAFLFSVSNMLESYTMEKTRQSLRGLMDLAPREATVRRGTDEVRVPVEQLDIGDIVIVKPGEKIAVDGVVVRGSSSVNQAAITGESVPAEKGVDDEVYAGTLNELGALEIRATKTSDDSTLAKIIHLVEEAQSQRAPSQALVDRFARYYTPAILALAALLATVPPLLFGAPWSDWVYRALALIVVACPCALVISTPVAIVTAIGNAARHGVLIKGGAFLEQAGRLTAIAMDKTGTLTRGRPEVTDIIALNGVDAATLLAHAAAVETHSTHPLADAVVRAARVRELDVPAADDFAALPGRGALALVGDHCVYVGNARLFREYEMDTGQADAALATLQADGKTAMLVGMDRQVVGILAAADQPRRESAPAVRALHRAGQQVVMLTGDNRDAARHVAAAIGVDEVQAELLPEDKVTAVRTLRDAGNVVGMVGDGINDAPALATADVGIAMGAAGTDAALETADIALMADDLHKLPYTIRLSRKALAIIRQNIALALAIKFAAVALAFAGLLTLWLAVIADMGASLLVTLNAMRLLAEKPAVDSEAGDG